MLLTRRQGQHVRALSIDIDGLAGETSRHMSFERVLDDHEADVRSAVLRRDSPRLSFTDADVESVRTGRRQNPQRRRFGNHCDLRYVRNRGNRIVVLDDAEEVWRLNGDGERAVRCGAQRVHINATIDLPSDLDDLDAEVLDVRADGGGVLRMHTLRDDDASLSFADTLREQDRFAQRCRAVVQRSVRDIESRQQTLMRLIFEDRLRPLRHLGLIRRVRREEFSAQQKLIDARRLVVRVRAAAEKRDVIDSGLVARRERAEPSPRLDLRPRAGDVEQSIELDVFRDRVEQTVDRIDADDAKHLRNVV